MAGKAENITNSAQLGLELGLSLAKGCFRLFRVGGRVNGKAESITNSAQLGLWLGLILAILPGKT